MMLVNHEGRVLVAKRSDMKTMAWQMPQGGIDGNETAAAAALRELEEEVGTDKAEIVAESKEWLAYDLPDELRKKVWKGRYRGQRQKWFVLRFKGRDDDIDLEGRNREFDEWKWVYPGMLPTLIVPFKRALYEDVLAEFSQILHQLKDTSTD